MPRCLESSFSFLEGAALPGLIEGVQVWPPASLRLKLKLLSQVEDLLMNFQEYCPRYEEEVGSNETAEAEVRKMEGSEEWGQMVAGVSARVGVSINMEEMDLMWDMCR